MRFAPTFFCTLILALSAPHARAEDNTYIGEAPSYLKQKAATGDDTKGKTAPQPGEEMPKLDFTGQWVNIEGSNRFTLFLDQRGDTLTGTHALTREGGGTVDAVAEGQTPSIHGHVVGSSVVVRFRSGQIGNYSYGQARLTLRGDYLYWQIVNYNGTLNFPYNAVLFRWGKLPVN